MIFHLLSLWMLWAPVGCRKILDLFRSIVFMFLRVEHRCASLYSPDQEAWVETISRIARASDVSDGGSR